MEFPKRKPAVGSMLILLSILCSSLLSSVSGVCELGVANGGKLYNFSLASPSPGNPHGILSEDGFYKIAVNDTSLWFQPCSDMVFNHDPPRCLDCEGCGGPSHCGMKCSALVSKIVQGYPVCTTIGQISSLDIDLLEIKNPRKGVVVKTRTISPRKNCSLSVAIFCDTNGAEEPESLEVQGSCDYAVKLRHPAGCPKIISNGGNGFGWFGTFWLTLFFLLGAYFLIGVSYRFFFLGVRGANAIPNLEFWASVPLRLRVFLGSLLRRLRGQRRGSQNSYASMSF